MVTEIRDVTSWWYWYEKWVLTVEGGKKRTFMAIEMFCWAAVVHALNPSTREAEAGRSL